MKEKLQNEVTKIKEKLENYLSQCSKVIKTNEKIIKGIQIMEKENKNMIKILTYITKINKNKKDNNSLFQELMKNLKISFNEEKASINYDEYYFNGIQTPKDIEFKDIKDNSYKLFWKIDNLNIINIDNNQIKYKVELRKENTKEKFIKVYEGQNSNCLIENLNSNTNYEIRICSIYNNFESNWSIIKKIKTEEYNCDSIILDETNNKKEFLKKILEWSGFKKMELLFRGSRDGMTSKNFHDKCDNKGQTITLFQNKNGNIFGAYTSISWTSDGNWHNDKDSFIFTLTNIHNIEPTKFHSKNIGNEVYHHKDNGPVFGWGPDIVLYSDFINKDCFTDFPRRFEDVLKKGKSIFTGNINISHFTLKEIEIFKLIK